jgi:hypothetical protein
VRTRNLTDILHERSSEIFFQEIATYRSRSPPDFVSSRNSNPIEAGTKQKTEFVFTQTLWFSKEQGQDKQGAGLLATNTLTF